MPKLRLVLAPLALALGCTAPPVKRPAPARPAAAPPATLYNSAPAPVQVDLDALRFVGMDDGPVPEFSLRMSDGRTIESSRVVGDRAFVVVFFATWCTACEEKLSAVRDVIDAARDLLVLGVSLDDAATLADVPAFLAKHGLRIPYAAATENPLFFISYNPFDTIPLVVVVGKNGGLVDYQLGSRPGDARRLSASVDLAKRIGPLAPWAE